jgi:hypothetical protein
VIAERVSRLLGMRVCSLRRIEGRGYSVAYRAVAELDDGSSVFVKAGVEELTNHLLRVEQRFYRDVEAPFLPRLVAFDEDEPPLVVLEDLSEARWPPPWDEGSIDAVRRALALIAATPAPPVVEPIAHERERFVGGWAEIERDPSPFLSLGLCSRMWLEHSLPLLRGAAEAAPIDGDALIHFDVRSDNVCLTDRGAVLVDWNQACVANPDLDVAAWLPSLRLEGGPEPEELLPNAGGFAALLAGFFGSRAGLPPPPTAPHVRGIQLAQLRVALPWAARELGLEPPG